MCGHKSLSSWTTRSSSAHFIASNATGPFVFSPEQCKGAVCEPALPPWSHNTVALAETSGGKGLPPAAEMHQIWHVGDAILNASVWAPCFNSSEVPTHHTPPPLTSAKAGPTFTGTPINSENGAYVSYAGSPSGPWSRFVDGENNSYIPIQYEGSWTSTLAGNPSPMRDPSTGDWKLYFTATPCRDGGGALYTNCIASATSKTGWRGPFTMAGTDARPITYIESEDPSVFIDHRGTYHLLTNVNTGHARCKQGVQCGGHAWSADRGATWTNLTVGAFGPYITLADGTTMANAYAERPLVTMNSDGSPHVLYLGMGRASYHDSCNWPQLFCTEEALTRGVKCGPTITPPSPPPTAPGHQLVNANAAKAKAKRCLGFDLYRWPCHGFGGNATCTTTMLPCADASGAPNPATLWDVASVDQTGARVFQARVQTTAWNVTINVNGASAAPGTLVSATHADGVNPVTPLALVGGMLQFTDEGGATRCVAVADGPLVLAQCAGAKVKGWSLTVAYDGA
jgi:hypothetical protein